MSLARKIFLTRIPQQAHESVHRWANGAVIPLVILFGGTHRVLNTAATPYEEYLGVVATTGMALAWVAVFVHALPVRRNSPQAPQQSPQQTAGVSDG